MVPLIILILVWRCGATSDYDEIQDIDLYNNKFTDELNDPEEYSLDYVPLEFDKRDTERGVETFQPRKWNYRNLDMRKLLSARKIQPYSFGLGKRSIPSPYNYKLRNGSYRKLYSFGLGK